MIAAVCPYCRTAFSAPEEELLCEGCGTPHHKDCYQENGGCTVFGCRCAPAEEPKVAVSGLEVAAAAAIRPAPVAYPAPSMSSVHGTGVAVAPQPSAPIIHSAITYVPEPQARNKMTFVLLGIFLGAFGGHNFYAGYYGKATVQLCLTLLTLGFGGPMSWIWAVIEVCIVSEDSKGVQFRS